MADNYDAVYDASFFESISDDSARSAAVLVPRFIDLVKPTSVVDVGCGQGIFLAAFADAGVTDVFGVDGGSPNDRAIDPSKFREVDLRQPLLLDRTFDLALCLEVAEHLPERVADLFVGELCKLAPVILWSAAIPMQGGHGHINERWPDYWIPKFAYEGYSVSGWPRLEFWGDERVAFFYRQNLLLFVRNGHGSDELQTYVKSSPAFSTWRLVHPDLFGNKLGVTFQ